MSDKKSENMPAAPSPSFGRRGLFRLGGLTVATAAVAVACGADHAEPVRVGVGASTPKLPEPVINNGVLLRTMAGIETSIANAYSHILETGALALSSEAMPDLGDQSALVTAFLDHHVLSAERFNALAEAQGAEPWLCGNTRLDSAFITPIFDRVENGVAATASAKEVAASDDPARDMINLVHTLESLSAASCQALVPQVTESAIRGEALSVGVRSARQAALIALRINPGAYLSETATSAVLPAVSTTTGAATTTTQNIAAPGGGDGGVSDAPPPTAIPLPVAIPSQFGGLAAITYIGGAGDENGVRLKLNFETPSLNSFAYPFDACAS